jgi:very-short-patch-repair endonuclease
MGVYILDFYCAEVRLAVEVDGEGHSHPDQVRHDQARDRWLESQGVRVLRFAASAVLDEIALDGILNEIVRVASDPPP